MTEPPGRSPKQRAASAFPPFPAFLISTFKNPLLAPSYTKNATFAGGVFKLVRSKGIEPLTF